MEHDLRISTAEHVGISYELAGVGSRVLAGFIAITARGLVRLLDVVPFVLPIDILLIVLTGKSQRLGDLVAGTVVVKARVQRDFLALRTQVPAAAGDLTVRGLS